jgi:predicted N-acyltransferase
MKCCSDCDITSKEDHLSQNGFLFRYTLEFCKGCGQVKANSLFKDGKKVEHMTDEQMIEYLYTNYHWTNNEKMKLISERLKELSCKLN